MANYLVSEDTQEQLATQIDRAVRNVLSMVPSHGTEEGVTPVLGQAIADASFRSKTLVVDFNYRQLNKQTEEPHAGADGGFLVRVQNADTTVLKASLFQAKLLKGTSPVRKLTMRTQDAARLQDQVTKMLRQSDESVGLFYTERDIYVVDAEHYRTAPLQDVRTPLSERCRLVTLGTYLGRWMARCTRGDVSQSLCDRIEHLDGFRHSIGMSVVCRNPSIRWREDRRHDKWRRPRN